MIKRTLMACCIAVIAASHTHAAQWVKGYVVGFYDPAFRYGGRADYSRGTEIEPGVGPPGGVLDERPYVPFRGEASTRTQIGNDGSPPD